MGRSARRAGTRSRSGSHPDVEASVRVAVVPTGGSIEDLDRPSGEADEFDEDAELPDADPAETDVPGADEADGELPAGEPRPAEADTGGETGG